MKNNFAVRSFITNRRRLSPFFRGGQPLLFWEGSYENLD